MFGRTYKVPGEFNPDPTGTGEDTVPKGGLQQYQDDVDTSKKDVVSDEVGDDPSSRSASPREVLAEELGKQDKPSQEAVGTDDDLREHIEDMDEGDKERSLEPWNA